jgi:arsenite methyltransferase
MSEPVLEHVQSRYAAVAVGGVSGEQAGVRAVAEAFGYSPEELAAVPPEANLGLSCGNPTAFASLRPGETVIDLGCGGGLDVILAAAKVGPSGKAIGVDMTPEMIALAQRNAAKKGLSNVAFHLARIDQLPLADASADCIISNCVINLAPDKAAVFREMHRVLKPGGRVAVSDIALKKPLPEELLRNMLAYVGCVSGAISIDNYARSLRAAGFQAVQVVDKKADLNAYAHVTDQVSCCAPAMNSTTELSPNSSCCGAIPSEKYPELYAGLTDLLKRYDINEFAASVYVYAIKGDYRAPVA